MSASPPPRVHLERFAVGADAIDANRHVNNKEYLAWMEAIAIAHSTACGWSLERYAASGTSWYVRSHAVDYLAPAFEGDRLVAATWVESMETSSSWRRYAFLRESDRRPIALARTLWIHVENARGRPRAIPEALRRAFPIVADDDPALAALGLPRQARS